ncbi:MAG: DUF3603 family protein [Bacilli bacterium]|nr:DUF3603 family protein [Bacilli bacterium]
MNYYYDVILNWNEDTIYEFYEWNDTDYLELIKKIPLFKVHHNTLIDALSMNIKVWSEFLDLIKDKTLISGKNIINKIEYACLLTDNKNVLALEFNNKGEVINRSKLLVDDELNVLEASFNIKEYLLNYEVLNALPRVSTLRQELDAKRLITLEINSLYQNQDLAKLKYLYYEYKKKTVDDIDFIHQSIIQDLENFNQDILKLYYIIKLSYHNV